MLEVLVDQLGISEADDLYCAASYVLSQDLVHGDAMQMRDHLEVCVAVRSAAHADDAGVVDVAEEQHRQMVESLLERHPAWRHNRSQKSRPRPPVARFPPLAVSRNWLS